MFLDSLDYTSVSRTLTFAPGTVSQTVPVPILDDNVNEDRERFTAALSEPQGADLGSRSTASVIIEDEDCEFIVQILNSR